MLQKDMSKFCMSFNSDPVQWAAITSDILRFCICAVFEKKPRNLYMSQAR
jgi:hypothetical protein